MNNHIAQTTQPAPVTAPPAALAEWGLLGAILFLLLKEGIAFFKQKDTSESALTSALITDLRESNKELRTSLGAVQTTFDKLQRHIETMEGRLGRHSTEIAFSVREELTRVDIKLQALHSRFDAAGLPTSIHRGRAEDDK